MSAPTAREKALLRGLAYVSRTLLLSDESDDFMPLPPDVRQRLIRVKRALRHDLERLAETMPRQRRLLLKMHIDAAVVGDLYGEYRISEAERGSINDPSTWRVEAWFTPPGEGS